MEYMGSTQAKHWLFTKESLRKCREQAVVINDQALDKTPRKFASGYHAHPGTRQDAPEQSFSASEQAQLSVEQQECIVQFHLQQLDTLCGPKACLESLRTSEKVLFTAITFVRRFYLSNSALQYHPRHICVAAAFLASKVEEEKIEVRSRLATHIV